MSFIASLLITLISILVFLNAGKVKNERGRLAVQAIATLVGAIAAISAIFRSLLIIPAGNIGVVESLGRVSERTLNPGVHLVNPFTEVEIFSTRLKDVKETIEATSQEGLAFNIDVSLQYKLDPQKAAEVYQNIGTEEEDIITSRFRSLVREITASYPAVAIYSTKRQEVANQLRQRLSEQLLPLGFIVEEALLREVKLPDTLQAAIEQKLQVEQQSQQMKFTLEKERQEAERKRIQARGISDSQKIISQGLSDRMLQLRAIEATEKLAQSPNSKIVVMGGQGQGGLPILLQPEIGTSTNAAAPKP